MRIICAELKQESSSFSPVQIDIDDFEDYYLHRGADVEFYLAGTRTEIAGFYAVARREGFELLPAMAAMAMSGGPLTRETFDTLLRELVERVSALMPADGILLALHGAMLVDGVPDPEGQALASLREVLGQMPLVVTLDLHANLRPGLLKGADGVVGFDTCPHTDLFETGVRGAELLLRIIRRGASPRMAYVKVPLIMPPDVMDTSRGPLAEIIDVVRALRGRDDILSTSVFIVQPWLDVPDLGCGVLAVAEGDVDSAKRAATRLAKRLWERRHEFQIDLHPVDEAIDLALAADGRPIVFSDSGDSIGSGSTGDATGILRGLLDSLDRLPGDALITVVDPQAVREAALHDPGEGVSLLVGGKIDRTFNQPVRVDGVLRTLFHGDFNLSGPSYTDLEMHMGLTAVVEAGRLKVVITSNRTWTHSPDFYRAVGLEPAGAKIVVVKSNILFKASYEPMAREILWVDAPGVSSPNLTRLPYRHIPRPLYPFEDFDWTPKPISVGAPTSTSARP